MKNNLEPILAYLFTARPTAVNLGAATRRLTATLNRSISQGKTTRSITQDLIDEGKAIADEDVGRNKAMSKWGGDWLFDRVKSGGESAEKGLNVLTVCNTGSLATSVSWPFFSSHVVDNTVTGVWDGPWSNNLST